MWWHGQISNANIKSCTMGRAGAQLPIWPGEKDLDVLVHSKLNVSQQQDLAVIKVNHIAAV